uniref:Stromal antigen 3 n=1 Tax=Echeneis naucrates TaxID=173247 RepID=A0A665WNJ5_ECHNA
RKAALRATSSPSSSPIPSPPDPSLKEQHSRGTSRQVSAAVPVRRVNETNQVLSLAAVSVNFKAVVDEWLDSYKRNREVGLLVLINFIVRSCGCKGVVSREMFESMQSAEIISKLTKEFSEDSVNYPLSTPSRQLKRFKAGLSEFAQVLVRSCRNSLIYDEYLFPSLLALLTGLSDSQVRAFRHTSTLLGKLNGTMKEYGIL